MCTVWQIQLFFPLPQCYELTELGKMGVGRLAQRERVSEKGTIITEALKCPHLPSVCYSTVAKNQKISLEVDSTARYCQFRFENNLNTNEFINFFFLLMCPGRSVLRWTQVQDPAVAKHPLAITHTNTNTHTKKYLNLSF